MELQAALELQLEFNNVDGIIRVDENEFLCLTDLAKYFPKKQLSKWRKSDNTSNFIQVLSESIGENCISSKRGKYNGGTYAHEDLAMKFCMWLSPEFELSVIHAFKHSIQDKHDYNVVRLLASYNYKMMSQSVKDNRLNNDKEIKGYHYMNEAKLINNIVFGYHEKCLRDSASEVELEAITWLESRNAAYLDINVEYQKRKEVLSKLHRDRVISKRAILP